MKILDKIVGKIEDYVCIITLIVMLLLTFANVLSRFVLHFSLSFTEEIVTGLFVIASLSGTSVAVRNRSHLGLDFVIGFMPEKIRKVLAAAATILAFYVRDIVRLRSAYGSSGNIFGSGIGNDAVAGMDLRYDCTGWGGSLDITVSSNACRTVCEWEGGIIDEYICNFIWNFYSIADL